MASRPSSFALLAAMLCAASLGAGCARKSEELVGTMREGSLSCESSRRYRFVLEGPKTAEVRVDGLMMPDSLRDWPGKRVRVTAVGSWDVWGNFVPTELRVASGAYGGPITIHGRYYANDGPGLPPSCVK